jgi:hypothetical protein
MLSDRSAILVDRHGRALVLPRLTLCLLLLGLMAGCSSPGPSAYRSDQDKQVHYGYQYPALRLLTI